MPNKRDPVLQRVLDVAAAWEEPEIIKAITDLEQRAVTAEAALAKVDALFEAIEDDPAVTVMIRTGRNRIGVSTGGWNWSTKFDGPEETADTFREALEKTIDARKQHRR